MADGVVAQVANGDVEVSFGADGAVSGSSALTTLNRLTKVTATGTIGMSTVSEASGVLTVPSGLTVSSGTTALQAATCTTLTASGNVLSGAGSYFSARASGSAAPSLASRSAGTKFILYDLFSAGSSADVALGVESGFVWYGVNTGGGHKWYTNATNTMTLSPAGALTTAAGITCTTLTASGGSTPGTPTSGQSLIGNGAIKAHGEVTCDDGSLRTRIYPANIQLHRTGAASYTDITGIGGNYVIRTSSVSSLDTTALTFAANGAATFGAGITCTTLTASGTAGNSVKTDGGLAIKDGITAPSTEAGYALIYVDTADGDLKVKFGDGTVKTIVTDT